MQTSKYILALDLGTTGNRAFIFDAEGKIVGNAYKELSQYYPQPGWLEHNPEEIWHDTCWVIQTAIANANPPIPPTQIAAIGISVQRETCLLWDKTTGKPIHHAIVWQDRRTAAFCYELQAKGYTSEVYNRTGLVIDAYFSATKLKWLLDDVKKHIPHLHLNNILAGTIDTWILWKLTGGKIHATDHSNASRTMLMNLTTAVWDESMLDLFQIPVQILPKIQPCLSYFGVTDKDIFGVEIPITAMLGDQQAALFGHGCSKPGLVKCTYGTGSFLVANTGSEIVRTSQKLISTIAWTETNSSNSLDISYALEGSMFTSGACIQWLRDSLKLIKTASETETMANQVTDNGGVYFVPALSGLGAPHWDMNARGAFLGITGGTQPAHIVRAVLEAIAYQVQEVVTAINVSSATPVQRLVVDGGVCENNFLMQFQADILGIPVERPVIRDVTVQGAAFAAGLTVGLWKSYAELVKTRQIERIFVPTAAASSANFSTWQKAVERAKNWREV
ncbi:glycerol kinase GlpK [Calothrix sp. UHCC 0171]|uniref:glycerol kinase GlpK n=1 Tax=Calothrix sp. UHCC 0171 TaxID=3110245 RepID=UPI002B1F5104|nr:glycerol kinase GlpK [Calothrix sp. UHCC 0171]MEA5569890.1 glycerol kinase GlpK [Calothrix sp. UHCC 0171]